MLIPNNFPQASHKGVKEEAQASWKKWSKWSASCGGASHSLGWKKKKRQQAAAIFPKQSLTYIARKLRDIRGTKTWTEQRRQENENGPGACATGPFVDSREFRNQIFK
jgi:hypothetical protein